MIQKVITKVKSGTKIFHRHGKTNSHAGRTPVGEILTTYAKEIGGKLRAISIACMEAADAQIFDICSIEASVYMDNGIVGDVENVTALAVDNSKNDQPAFRNAKRMAMVQCFTPVESGEPGEGKNNMPITQEEVNNAPFSMLAAAIKTRAIMPWQVFTLEDISKDKEFGTLITDKQKLEEVVERQKQELADKDKEIGEISKKVSADNAKELFDKLLPEGLTDRQKKYYKESFDPNTLDKVDEETVKASIKTLQDSYKVHAKLFGVDEQGDGDLGDGGAKPKDPPKEGTNALNEAFDDLD